MMFNGVEIPEEVIIKTREYFINNAELCIVDAKNKTFYVNDLKSYVKSRQTDIQNYKDGLIDNTFTFRQHAYYLMTGESVALLP